MPIDPKKLTSSSREMLKCLRVIIAAMDALGRQEKPLLPKHIAKYANALEMEADKLAHFGLGQSFPTIQRDKKMAEKALKALQEGR